MKNKYEIRGDVTAIFINCKGETFETIIDTDDLEIANSFPNTWYGNKNLRTGDIYVQGVSPYCQLHRLIMCASESKVIDHIYHDTLDNRRSYNLREITGAENSQNLKGASKNSKSGYLGVHWSKLHGKWCATIRGKHLGYFDDIIEAHNVAQSARSKFMKYSKEAGKEVPYDDLVVPFRKKLSKQSGVSGVTWDLQHKKWKVRITINGKRTFLGRRESLIEAISLLKSKVS